MLRTTTTSTTTTTTTTTTLLPPRIIPNLTISNSSPPDRPDAGISATSRINLSLSVKPRLPLSACSSSSSSLTACDFESIEAFEASPPRVPAAEELIEKVVYRCRFLTIFGVMGSLVGSLLCFLKGCTIVAESFLEYFANRGKVMAMLIEATDTYLLGTVMLVFGMGLYELFISNLDIAQSHSDEKNLQRSNLFGLFTLVQRPKWLEIKSVNELKTKVGHVIVMLLLIGLFDKAKKAVIQSPTDLLCFAASVLLSSCCLYLLSKLNGST